MKRIKVPFVPPDSPIGKELSIRKFMQQLQNKEGLVKIHLVDETENSMCYLSIDYDPYVITIDQIRSFVRRTWASIADKYGHRLIEVEGIHNARQAQEIEIHLKNLDGILQAAVSPSGMIGLEFKTAKINDHVLSEYFESQNLKIISFNVSVGRYIQKTSSLEE